MNRILVAVVGLACASCGIARDSEGMWVKSVSDQLTVRARTFIDSSASFQEWNQFVDGGGDIFGASNKYFSAEIADKKSGKKIRIPMIPVSEVVISPSSSYIVVLSSYYPTDGLVVLDRNGKVVWKEFSICLAGQTCVVSDQISSWLTPNVAVTFAPTDKGAECSLTIEIDAGHANSSSMSLDICSPQTTTSERKRQ